MLPHFTVPNLTLIEPILDKKKFAEEEDLPFTSRSAPLIDYKPWHAPKIAIQYADFTPFLWEMSPETG